MYCQNCGKEINEKAVICVGCGVPVAGTESPFAAAKPAKQPTSADAKSPITKLEKAALWCGFVSKILLVFAAFFIFLSVFSAHTFSYFNKDFPTDTSFYVFLSNLQIYTSFSFGSTFLLTTVFFSSAAFAPAVASLVCTSIKLKSVRNLLNAILLLFISCAAEVLTLCALAGVL